MVDLYPHQQEAVAKMHNGCILVGGVGTGKSRTALYYYTTRVCGKGGKADPPLFIITTARKRDTKDWEKEAEPFDISAMTVDSWNNIQKYSEVEAAFFIFDEQRLVGTGKWAKAFRKIAKHNQWILLSATPGDCWNDYANVFIANGFYRNLTDFRNQHIVYSRFTKYPKIDHYVGMGKLMQQRKQIVVLMPFARKTIPHDETVYIPYDRELTRLIGSTRWDPFKDQAIQDAGALCYVLRRAVNSDERRVAAVADILAFHPKAIVFYNFDYELEALRKLAEKTGILHAEWNGHRHEPIPEGDSWIYLVQYTAGAEGWNCVETDTMIFFSLNYSYKCMAQARGRIDRLNTPYVDLYYFQLMSRAPIDLAIYRAIKEKRTFNESGFAMRIPASAQKKHTL